jgi:hypothetical protein
MLVTLLVFVHHQRTRAIQVCKWRDERGTMSVEHSQKKSISGLNRASEQSDFNDQDSSKGTDQRLAGNRG